MTEALASLEALHASDLAQPEPCQLHRHFWVGAAILTVAALAAAPLLRRSVTETAADGAPACVELKGAS